MSPVPNFPPPGEDPSVQPFWAATAQGELALPACTVCGSWQWYPLPDRPCHPGSQLEWRKVVGEGTVFTFSRVERSFLPFGGDTPYTVALIELDGVNGPRLVTVLVGDGSESPEIGDRVRLSPTVFETHTLPTFELIAS